MSLESIERERKLGLGPSDQERFGDWDSNVISSSCITCRYKHADKPTCMAFPGKIPEAILDGSHDHQFAFKGDQGIQWEEDVIEMEDAL